jgi:hypothetical protein
MAADDEGPLFVARRATRPQVWLGEPERVSDVAPRLGAWFPATATKERDFVLDLTVTRP